MLHALRRRQFALIFAIVLGLQPSIGRAEPWTTLWLTGSGAAFSAAGLCQFFLEPGHYLQRRRQIAVYRGYVKLLNTAITSLPTDDNDSEFSLHVDYDEQLARETLRQETKTAAKPEIPTVNAALFAEGDGTSGSGLSAPAVFSAALGKNDGVARLDHERWPLSAYVYTGGNWEPAARMHLRLYVAPEATLARSIGPTGGLYILFISKTSFILNQWMDQRNVDMPALSISLAQWMERFRELNPGSRVTASLLTGPSHWHADGSKGPALTQTGVIRITGAATALEYARANLHILRQMSKWVAKN